MNWIVNIEKKKDQRIKVVFDPLNELIIFMGQYKPHNKEWLNFSEITHVMDIDLDGIKLLIEKSYDLMNKRLEFYKNIDEGFNVIRNIEIDDK